MTCQIAGWVRGQGLWPNNPKIISLGLTRTGNLSNTIINETVHSCLNLLWFPNEYGKRSLCGS